MSANDRPESASTGMSALPLAHYRRALVRSRLEAQGLQRQLQEARSELDHYRGQAMLSEAIVNSRSWRWTRPLRFLMRLLRYGLGAEDHRALRALLRGGSQPSASLPAAEDAVDQPPPMPECPAPGARPDVYMWAVIDWHFRIQRPQHLARELANAGHRVFYISNDFIDASGDAFAVEALDATQRLWRVRLPLPGAPSIYAQPPTLEQRIQLGEGLAALARWHGGRDAISIVQHPFWAYLATRPPATWLVYDCMDHHGGFDNNSAATLAEEAHLVGCADLVMVTSQWLDQQMRRRARNVALVRNGTDYAHFSDRPAEVFSDPRGRRVLGYFGAIAEWFDTDLIAALAQRHPEHLIVLVGDDSVGAGARLADYANVMLVGEVSYATLPYWLHGFDVCLLPFKVGPLTMATNPVKVYEYLSAGLPVVAVALPEMRQFEGLVRIASSQDEFLQAVQAGLDDPGDATQRQRRHAFARGQTWAHRAGEVDRALAAARQPRVSVIIVTYNNLSFTRACLESVEACSDWTELEVIVVDNASADGTPEFLSEWADAPGHGSRQVILNPDNRGFAAANNQGLHVATGDYLILLNNDTYVTHGWIRGLLTHLQRDPSIGIVGPVTNNIGNEARIETDYADMAQMAEFAAAHVRQNPGLAFEIPTLAFFCVAIPRTTLDEIGLLDESYGLGFFEDDDYCQRVLQAGMRCVCAEDVFIHHHLSASFEQVGSEQRRELFERNRRIFESKWGTWEPHLYR